MNIDWTHLPSLTALRAFAAVAQSRSFSGAARGLNVTHAAVAQQVRALEAHLGVGLVLREGRGLVLTREGETLAASLDDAFGAMAKGVAAVIDRGRETSVHVSLTSGFAAQWLMPRLRHFWAAHPDIALTLHPDTRVVDLRRDGMDVAIRYGMGQWPGVQAEYLTSARMVIAGAPSLLGPGPAPPRDIWRNLPWVLSIDWPEGRNWLRSRGIDPPEDMLTELPSEELAIGAAREGLGLIAESHALLEEDLRLGRLILLEDEGARLPAYFCITQPGQDRRAVRIFARWLIAAA
ncbi:MAG: LysR substrate-binding domain-containing protein [Rhodobacteraceae bacterium]|jgi:LysR family transcriptional regulator, glycine cleavage system transcriptional activator|nr:LysR substrate-binding domain-containing protein [Paracoccaceae bacterium]